MVDRYLSVKFGVNPLDGFRENDVYGLTDGRRTDGRTTDGRRTTDARVTTVALLCSSTKQS